MLQAGTSRARQVWVNHAFLVLLNWRFPMALMVLTPVDPLCGRGGSLRLRFRTSPPFTVTASASPPSCAPSGSSATDGVLLEWDRLSLVSSRGVVAAGAALLISRRVIPFSPPAAAASSSS